MLSNNSKITELMYESPAAIYARLNGVTLNEAEDKVKTLSFAEYHSLVEASADITPPSGKTIAPTSFRSSAAGQGQDTVQSTSSPSSTSNIKASWPGGDAPIEQGMTVGLKGPNNVPVPGEVTQVDGPARGVKVKNPTTGQEEWYSNDDINPFMANGTAPQTPATAPQQPQVAEDLELSRMLHLAGIKENCSGGATGAGAIAIAPAAMGSMKKRQGVDEAPAKEYTPKEPAKTIVGDTKPHQASGELSANLAVRGKKTASRTNNGFKR